MTQAVIIDEYQSFESLTQPWMVRVAGKEVARFATYMQAYRHIKFQGLELAEEEEVIQAEVEKPKQEITASVDAEDRPAPEVGDHYLAAGYRLKCVEVAGTDYAVVWDVYDQGVVMGEIRMDYFGFWSSSQSLSFLTTPYEALLDLVEFANELAA